jgi:ketosteroid isomerase-like protein
VRLSRLVLLALFIQASTMAETSAAGSSLDWMTGHWCQEHEGAITEELWLPPAGGVLVGVGRSRTPDRTTEFEYLRIVETDGVPRYIAQPGGNPPTEFMKTGGGEDWVRFENPEHDFPRRIEYRRDGNALLAQAAGPGRDGQELVLTFAYSACVTDATPASGESAAIRSLRAASNAAIAAHDAGAVASFLDEDYVITISTGAIERSRREAVESFAAHFVEFPDVVYVRTPTEIIVSETYPLAFETGTWVGSRTDANGPLENGGRYTASWRKVDGAWKIHAELFVGLYCRGKDC